MAIEIPPRLNVLNLTDDIRTFFGGNLEHGAAWSFQRVLRMKALKHIQVCRNSLEKMRSSSVERSGLCLTAVEFY